MVSKAMIDELEAATEAPSHPEFRVGDTVRVHVRIVEGQRERIQAFEGVVICRRRGGNRATFTVRKVSYGVGVERIFPICSPRLQKIEVVARGRVRRNRLFYLRERSGKAARIRTRIETKAAKAARLAAAAAKAAAKAPRAGA